MNRNWEELQECFMLYGVKYTNGTITRLSIFIFAMGDELKLPNEVNN